MSLAGPHGEAACIVCHTLVDLDVTGRLAAHRCPGGGAFPANLPRELDSLAFSSEPVERFCPHCNQRVVINTVSQSRSGWRYSYHRAPHLKAALSWEKGLGDCPGSWQLVGYGKEDGVTVQMAPVDEAGEPGEYRTLDGVTLHIEPYAEYEGF